MNSGLFMFCLKFNLQMCLFFWLTPEELRPSKRIAAFRDFVQEEIISYRKDMRAKEKI